MPRRHQEISNDKLPAVPQRTNPQIQAQGDSGKSDLGYDFRQAISLRKMRLPILSLVVHRPFQCVSDGNDELIQVAPRDFDFRLNR